MAAREQFKSDEYDILKEHTESIIYKWNDQKKFIRYIDGNKDNTVESNKQEVPLHEAFEHFYDWTVDWFKHLNEEEIQVVNNTEWRNGLRFKTKQDQDQDQDQDQNDQSDQDRSEEKESKTNVNDTTTFR